MKTYAQMMQAVLEGIPWSSEKAKAAGFPSVYAARDRVVNSAHFVDNSEEQWHSLEALYRDVVREVCQVLGDPKFQGRGAGGLHWEGVAPEIDRLAYWLQDDHIAYVKLELCDNTGIRMLSLGERNCHEVERR